ncbi:MAG: hypothetical protein ABSG43_21785 [Solirubrobacteraceae bacterium]
MIEEQFLASQVLACHRPRAVWLSVLRPMIIRPVIGGVVAWLRSRICSQHMFVRDSPDPLPWSDASVGALLVQ